MGQLENKFAQAATGTKNEEKEELAIEKKAAENAEADVSSEQVEAFAEESEKDIDKVSGEVVLEGKQNFENAIQTGEVTLKLEKEEIEQIAKDLGIDENLQTKDEEIEALKREKKEKISKIVEVQPESAQEVKITEGMEAQPESSKEETIEKVEAKPEYSKEEAREVWKSLSEDEQLAYCNPETVAQEMSKDLHLETSPDKKPFSGEAFSENAEIINDNVRSLIEAYTKDGESKISPEYGEKIRKSVEDYVGLVAKAQQEGSIANELKAADVQKIAEDIVNKMVYQNRESLKRGLGDHGVRHIIDGNIAEAMKMIDAYNKGNPEKPLSAKERLKMMTLHFNHDMGYTVGINRKGFDTLGSHPMFSKKLFDSQNEMYGALFNSEDLAQISKTIETHDQKDTNFETQAQAFESIARLSDNLGLFHDSKLPEIFYSVPENMVILQKIYLAKEAGQSIVGLKKQLRENVAKQSGLDRDTKNFLLNAAKEINEGAPKFNLGMLAGKLDGYEMQGSKMVVNIRESDMHQQIQELFKLNQAQFVKALDSYGIKLDKGTSFDEYVKTDADGTKYVELPMTEGKPALRFNFLAEDKNNPDARNAEIKKKFSETATEWAGMNIRAEINSAMKELKESKEARTSENIDSISFELQAQLDDEKLSTKDREQISGLMSGLKNSLNNEEEFANKLDQFGKFLTEKEKEFLAVN